MQQNFVQFIILLSGTQNLSIPDNLYDNFHFTKVGLHVC